MKELEARILSDGKIKPGGILKVDSFLNHQLDPELFYDMATELKRLFGDARVDKILTVEASGIALAIMAAYVFGCKAVFAKKSKSKNISDDVYSAEVVFSPTATPTPSYSPRNTSTRAKTYSSWTIFSPPVRLSSGLKLS